VVNVAPPDLPPSHQIQVNIDASDTNLWKAPHPVTVTARGNGTQASDTKVSLVELPPIKIPSIPPIVTVDFRNDKNYADMVNKAVDAKLAKFGKNFTQPDLQVVQVSLPRVPALGRDVTVKMPTIDLGRFMPSKGNDTGELKTKVGGAVALLLVWAPGPRPDSFEARRLGGRNAGNQRAPALLTHTTPLPAPPFPAPQVSIIDATLPSLNRIEALNKPLIKPGNFSITHAPKGKGNFAPWSLKVSVEDKLTGGSKVTPLKIGEPLPKDSLVNVLREAAASSLPSSVSGQYCHYKCCPACKPAPVKVEYAEPIYTCPADCSFNAEEGRCMCSPAEAVACPTGKRLCELGAKGFTLGLTGLCVDEGLHDKLCMSQGAVCLAQNKVPECPAV
jgi:hypothetical protein